MDGLALKYLHFFQSFFQSFFCYCYYRWQARYTGILFWNSSAFALRGLGRLVIKKQYFFFFLIEGGEDGRTEPLLFELNKGN